MRDMIFVSHANPEDNEFALWISLQLAALGYPVWCDLTKLIGGEVFWLDIESAIRIRTSKFLYVLTRASNEKPGARDELALALAVEKKEKLKDFVIPLWLDDLSPADFNVQLFRRNAVPFQRGWASGLAAVLKKLAEDGVPTKTSFGPTAVTAWWRAHVNAAAGLREQPEPLYSNWYPLAPTTLYFHELRRDEPGPVKIPSPLPYPGVQYNQYLVTFAPAEDFADQLGDAMKIAGTVTRRVNDPDSAREPRLWSFSDERKALASLLRQAWERLLRSRDLPKYEFANERLAFYLTDGTIPNNRVLYTDYDGSRARRDMIGYKTMKGARSDANTVRHWHFSLEAKPTSSPIIGYTMKPHVLFSDDGKTIWESKDRLHRARRSQCKDWWNDRWRDLIAAGVSFLANDAGQIRLPVGSSTELWVLSRPVILSSPISFDESSLLPQEVETYAESDDRDDATTDDEAVDAREADVRSAEALL
jgi:hypothetical protein